MGQGDPAARLRPQTSRRWPRWHTMQSMSDECQTNVDNAMNAIYAAKQAIESVTRGVYTLNTNTQEQLDKREAEVEAAWNAAQAASQAVWTADQSCHEDYPELYEAYGHAADAATNCSTARVEQNYETYIDTAYSQLDQALAKFPW